MVKEKKNPLLWVLQFSFFWKLMCFYWWIERLFVGFYLVGWETRGMNVSCKVMRWTMIEYFGTLLLVSWSNDCVTIRNQNSFERYNTQILTFSILQYLVQFCFLFFCFFPLLMIFSPRLPTVMYVSQFNFTHDCLFGWPHNGRKGCFWMLCNITSMLLVEKKKKNFAKCT